MMREDNIENTRMMKKKQNKNKREENGIKQTIRERVWRDMTKQ